MTDARPPESSFGWVLRAHRVTARLTQEELAERARLSVRAIADLERGRTARPRLDSVRRLAAALELAEPALGQLHLAARGLPVAAATVAAPPGERSGSDNRATPRMLPAAVPAFAGRKPELAALSRMLDQSGGMAVITAVGGTAGVGKTALAVHWGHQVAPAFPDGQLFVNLRGFDPSSTPVTAADALLMLLYTLGVPPDRVPRTLEAQAGLYRSLLAGKQMLIVLDNASDEAQVRPLLPGSPTCRVVVTSRNQLTGLAAVEAARLLMLDVLTGAESAELLGQRLGADRLSAEPDTAAQVIMACAYLPLALSIVAARVVATPDLSLSRVATELASSPGLGDFSTGRDQAADVRAVLSWSYRCLNPDAARAFRLAGTHPGPDLDRYAIAALAQTTPEQAGQLLATLAHGCLIQTGGPDRYRMHDLLKGYARELTDGQDAEEDLRASMTRLVDYYLCTAAAAMNALYPAERQSNPAIPQLTTPAPPVSHVAEARAWLDAERGNLVAVAAHAASGWPAHITRLSATLYRYLQNGAYYSEALVIHACARQAAGEVGDKAAVAEALNNLGAINWQLGRYSRATDCLREALDLYRAAGDRHGQGRALGNLGIFEWQQGNYQQAADYYQQALVLGRETGDQHGEARSLGNLGLIAQLQGHYQRASDHFRQALALYRGTGYRPGEARMLSSLGSVDGQLGRHQQATANLRQALALCRETGYRDGEAEALNNLGVVELRQDRYPQAASYLELSLALCRETGSRADEAEVLNGLGDVSLATNEPGQARIHYAAALDLAVETGNKYLQARARHGLGSACHDLGDPGQARSHWQQALTLYAGLGVPETALVRALLAQPPQHEPAAGQLATCAASCPR